MMDPVYKGGPLGDSGTPPTHTPSKPGESTAAFEGELAFFSLPELIQLVCSGGRDSEITISEDDRLIGRLLIRSGKVCRCSYGSLIGEKAFFQLAKLRSGRFRVVPWTPERDPESTLQNYSWQQLVLEAARLEDEEKREATPSTQRSTLENVQRPKTAAEEFFSDLFNSSPPPPPASPPRHEAYARTEERGQLIPFPRKPSDDRGGDRPFLEETSSSASSSPSLDSSRHSAAPPPPVSTETSVRPGFGPPPSSLSDSAVRPGFGPPPSSFSDTPVRPGFGPPPSSLSDSAVRTATPPPPSLSDTTRRGLNATPPPAAAWSAISTPPPAPPPPSFEQHRRSTMMPPSSGAPPRAPGSAFETLLQQATAAYLKRDFDQALKLFEECRMIDPSDRRVQHNIERIKNRRRV